MDCDIVVVMGVAGTGKSTVAKGISTLMGWPYAEGDAVHPQANVAKMHSGIPLTDEDRWPWLRLLGDWIDSTIAAGDSAVVTCSALRRAYREVLREGRPSVRFLHLHDSQDLIAERMAARTDHFMPPGLLPSQFATLEPLEPDEPGVVVSVAGDIPEVIERSMTALRLVPRESEGAHERPQRLSP